MGRSDKLKFGAILHGVGGSTDGWRHPSVDPATSTNFDAYKHKALTSERGLFSFVFIADGLYISDKSIPHFLNRFEPITVLSALAAVTQHVGLIATISTSFSDPFTISRQLLSLDHLSNGRAGWNLVTSPQEGAAHNFSKAHLPSHAERYEIAQEHLDVVRGLWDSWEDDAFTYDKKTGQFFDPEKLHRLNHQGKYFQVNGPLNVQRSKQGYPLVFQAGASTAGKSFAASNADSIFTMSESLEKAKDFYRDVKEQATAAGRNASTLRIFPGISPIVAESKEAAEAKYQEFAALVPIENAVTYLGRYFDDYDLTQFDLDAPFPDLGDIGKNAFQSFSDNMKKRAKEEGLTLRQAAIEAATPRPQFIGTAKNVADKIEEWFEEEAADGFIISSDIPNSLDDFVDYVIPLLQERGIYDTAYDSDTLRGNLNIPLPDNRYTLKKQKTH